MNHMTVDGPDAPWNEERNPPKEIDVFVSVTLSKTVKVNVEDYVKTFDEEERMEEIDCSSCNLHEAVESQIYLPQDKFTDWNLDDFECVLE